MSVPIRFVNNFSWEMKPGDAFWIMRGAHDPHPIREAGLVHCCIKCGRCGTVMFSPRHGGGVEWGWDGNREAPTVTGSILHDRGKCDWHGYLTAGMWVE